jgi:6,7-dimethyl-8-ribityllumazine synthase
MLKVVKSKKLRSAQGRFVIIASKYNARYVNSMLSAAKKILQKAGVKDLQVVRVPGAFEIPVVAARLIYQNPPLAALVCLGVIIRGQTAHAQLIGESVTQALTQLQIQFQVPIIHEVLLLENEQQAVARCLSKEHNRGAEAAQTALEMAQLMRRLS